MQTAAFIEALQSDLRELAALGDERTAAAAERLAGAIQAAAGLRLLDAVTEAALEISLQLPRGHVEVRVSGRDPQLVYVEEQGEEERPAAEDGLAARITLRLPDSLKAAIEAAAEQEGASVNSWLVRALQRAVSGAGGRAHRPGKRITGFSQA
jgi:hypothetical protein